MAKLFGRIHHKPTDRPDWARHAFPFYVEELSDGYLRIIPPKMHGMKASLEGLPRPKEGFQSAFFLEDARDLFMPIDRIAWELGKFMPNKTFVILQKLTFETPENRTTPWDDPTPYLWKQKEEKHG